MRTTRIRRTALAVAAAGGAAALLAAAPAAVGAAPDATRAARAAVVGGTARNVILLLGDGMGDSEITVARNYAKGANGRLALDTLPLTGEYTTYSLQKADPSKIDYVTDSAASGTGWSTGYKTYNGAISVTPDGKAKPTILEQAQAAGFRTGNVTTAEVEDATPAVLEAHVTDRSCYGPVDVLKTCPTNAKENGGAGSIAEQEVAHKADLLLGGGSAAYDQTITAAGADKGTTVLQSAKRQGYQVVTTRDQLAAVSPTSKAPVLGLFTTGNFETEYAPLVATATGTAPQKCVPNPKFPATQPHLSDLASKALSVLDRRAARSAKHGFFLQIEGASIDKRDHASDLCGQIGETVEFDRSVRLALDYQQRHPDTLVVVTADHGHTSQIVEAGTTTQGATASVTTADDSTMTVSYATAPVAESQQHTGTEVRIAAKGPQAANVLGVTNQTDLNTTFRRALGLR